MAMQSGFKRPRSLKSFIAAGITSLMIMSCLTNGTSQSTASPETDEILKKIGVNYIKKTLDQSTNLDEAAKNIGVEPEELKLLCTALKIKIPYKEIEEEKAPKIEPVKVEPAKTEQVKTEQVKTEQVKTESSKPVSPKKLNDDKYSPDVVLAYKGQSPYLILVDKEAHQVYLFQFKNGKRSLVKTFECKTGKNQGDKKKEGDNRTPEGAFFFVAKYSRSQILSMVGKAEAYKYGEMAFVTDFPNSIDRVHGKDGGGIWLHGTDKSFEETSPNDTRGCVVLTNEDVKTIGSYIELYKTPFVIVDNLNIVENSVIEKKRDDVLKMIEAWRKAWENRDINEYAKYYGTSFTAQGMNRTEWISRKKSIFGTYAVNYVKFDDISIFRHNSGLVIQFVQDYSAENISNNIGVKTLYVMPEGESWKIIMEHFRKI